LAFLPKEEREQLLSSEKLSFYDDTSSVTTEQLREEFDKCRQVGYAQDLGDLHLQYNSVAAPVFGHNGKVVACLVVVGVFDESLVDDYGYKVVECAKSVSYTFGADVEKVYEKIAAEG
jgi:DNA-binding IclR family transcriptional regulator